jgi:hypothetical protein
MSEHAFWIFDSSEVLATVAVYIRDLLLTITGGPITDTEVLAFISALQRHSRTDEAEVLAKAWVAKPEAAVPNRAPITQSDIDRAVAELHRQKLPARMAPGRENAEDLAAMSAAGGVQ